jgi:hypothetical protein
MVVNENKILVLAQKIIFHKFNNIFTPENIKLSVTLAFYANECC